MPSLRTSHPGSLHILLNLSLIFCCVVESYYLEEPEDAQALSLVLLQKEARRVGLERAPSQSAPKSACVDVAPPPHKDWKYNSCEDQAKYTDKCDLRRNGTTTDGYCDRSCGLCADSWNETKPPKCKTIGYIRIQKTGSTTLGESIMPTLCAHAGQKCYGQHHWDYRDASSYGGGPGCAVTMLRDPVERFLSEFSMARGPDKFHLDEWQWDWREKDLPRLHELQGQGKDGIHDGGKAMVEYLNDPHNPTRNRQTLYLLGFDRIPDGYPAKAYHWHKDRDKLLAQAKSHLVSLLGFGISDCYVDSIVALADRAGWNKQAALQMARDIHKREQNREHALVQFMLSSNHSFFASADKREILVSTSNKERSNASSSWSRLLRDRQIDPKLEAAIREANSVDEELIAFARAEWYDRYRKRCAEPLVVDDK